MSRLVLDASATANFLLPDEDNSYGNAVLAYVHKYGALVPLLWNYEVTNLLTMAFRRKRIGREYRSQAFQNLQILKIDYWDSTGAEGLLYAAQIGLIAERCALSAYDAAYLFVAERERLAVATLDEGMVRAARLLGVGVFTV